MVILETDRLIVREWEDKDYIDLYEIGSDKNTNINMTYPLYTDIETAKERIADVKSKYEFGYKEKEQDYAIVLKEEDKVIGSIGIMHYSANAEGSVEIGYQLQSKYWGKGYMPEVVKSLIKYIFDNYEVKRIYARHNVDNPNSGKVMQKAGMIYEGTNRKSMSDNRSSRIDCAFYSILIEDIQK